MQWSDESSFLLHPNQANVRVRWRRVESNSSAWTIAKYRGGSILVWFGGAWQVEVLDRSLSVSGWRIPPIRLLSSFRKIHAPISMISSRYLQSQTWFELDIAAGYCSVSHCQSQHDLDERTWSPASGLASTVPGHEFNSKSVAHNQDSSFWSYTKQFVRAQVIGVRRMEKYYSRTVSMSHWKHVKYNPGNGTCPWPSN